MLVWASSPPWDTSVDPKTSSPKLAKKEERRGDVPITPGKCYVKFYIMIALERELDISVVIESKISQTKLLALKALIYNKDLYYSPN